MALSMTAFLFFHTTPSTNHSNDHSMLNVRTIVSNFHTKEGTNDQRQLNLNFHRSIDASDTQSDEIWLFAGDKWITYDSHTHHVSLMQFSQPGQDISLHSFFSFGHFVYLNSITNQFVSTPSVHDNPQRGFPEFEMDRSYLPRKPGGASQRLKRSGVKCEASFPVDLTGPHLPGDFVAFATAPQAIAGPHHFQVGYDRSRHNEIIDSIRKSIPPRKNLPVDWWAETKLWTPLREQKPLDQPGVTLAWHKHASKVHQVAIRYRLDILPGDRVQLDLDPAITAGMDIPSHIKTFYLFLQRGREPKTIPLEIPITPQSDGTCSGAFLVDLDQLQIKNQEFDALNVFSTSQGSSPLWLEDYSRQKRIPGKF
ncbi:MAG: hypothetical protein IPN71_01390 [Fibrobacteres bacterium]|nr:hypothetical protein [Fibrobacterota bacterium]